MNTKLLGILRRNAEFGEIIRMVRITRHRQVGLTIELLRRAVRVITSYLYEEGDRPAYDKRPLEVLYLELAVALKFIEGRGYKSRQGRQLASDIRLMLDEFKAEWAIIGVDRIFGGSDEDLVGEDPEEVEEGIEHGPVRLDLATARPAPARAPSPPPPPAPTTFGELEDDFFARR